MMSNSAGPIVFFGMRCLFSGPPLAALAQAGYDVRAVVLPGAPFGPIVTRLTPPRPVPIAYAPPDDSIDEIARRAEIPILAVQDARHPNVAAAIAALHPSIIAVACFPWKLHGSILASASLGSLNVHPSLLPIGRGPEPLFWTFRRGEREAGTTIHLMNERLDAGPIVLQDRITIPDGIRAPDLERQLAEIGGRLLITAIDELVAGTAIPTAQDESGATSAPPPAADDYLVSTSWSARRAFNVVRALAPLGGPLALLVEATGERFALADALDYTMNDGQEIPARLDGDTLTALFQTGTVRFLLRQ